jgi:hypothetical protein
MMDRRSLMMTAPVLACSALALARQAQAADIRAALAIQMQAKPRDFVLNLPPRTGCLPGSIFTEDLPSDRTDPARRSGPDTGPDLWP